MRAAVIDAVSEAVGANADQITYNHNKYGGGSLGGVVEVPDATTFLTVLRTVASTLQRLLGAKARRVTIYLTGREPDGIAVVPGDLGLSQPPLAGELIDRLL